MKNKSTVSGIFEIVENILKNLDNQEKVFGLFLDLSKAFECIDHAILLKKLENYGVRGAALNLIKSYLSNRLQYVELCHKKGIFKSKKLKNTIGVPQDSILGPLLFIIYVNDFIIMQENVMSTQYADDTSLTICNKDVNILITMTNELLEEVNGWCIQNRLQLNSSKTQLINFNLKNVISDVEKSNLVSLDDTDIIFLNSSKVLGVHIDKNMKWETHIGELSKKLSKAL